MKIDIADKWFSKYIRLRDSDENGIIYCVSCGKPLYWKNADAGHFIKRQHKSLRFNEKNVNAQCKECNWLKQGNDIAYARGLVAKYDPYILDELEVLKNSTFHLGRFELKQIAEYYKKKFNELKKEKNLK